MVTRARFEKLALALPSTTSAPHFDRLAFRTPRKIFATLAPDGRSANLLLDGELQAAAVEARPSAFSPVPGGWGRMGYTTVDLTAVEEVDLVRVLGEAHAIASQPKPKRPKKIASASSSARAVEKRTTRKRPTGSR